MNIFTTKQLFKFGEAVCGPGDQWERGSKENLKLLFVHRGGVEIILEERDYYLPVNHAALIGPGREERLNFSGINETHFTWCEAIHPILEVWAQRQVELLPFCIPLSTRMEALLWIGVNLQAGEEISLDGLRNTLGWAVFYEYFYNAGLNREGRDHLPQSIIRTNEHIEENFPDPCDLSKLARIGNVSPQHLVRQYRRHFGSTPIQYLWQRRTERGVRLLYDSELTVGEIANRCGFQTSQHFSRMVKQRYARSPLMLRKEYWNQTRLIKSGRKKQEDGGKSSLLLRLANLEDLSLLLSFRELSENEDRIRFIGRVIQTHNCWVGFDKGEFVGCIVCGHNLLENGFVPLLFVPEQHRGKGYGTAFLQHAESLCLTRKIYTIAKQSNRTMRALLEKLGYRRSGHIENGGAGEPELVFSKDIIAKGR